MSSMCPTYSRSSRRILYLGLREHAVANPVVEELGGHQVHLPSEKRGEFRLNRDDLPTGNVFLLELVQHIDVAVRAEIISQDRAEERELANVVPPAKVSEPLTIHGNSNGH